MKRKQLLKINLQFFGTNRGQEIDARLAAIASELETRAAALTSEELTAFETEVTSLKEERKALKDEAERRATLLGAIAEGQTHQTIIRTFPAEPKGEETDPLNTPEYRKAFMQHVLRDTPIPKEYRASEVTTTTDIGAVIPTTVLNQIIETMEATGMILPLVTHTAYKGGVRIPSSSVKPTATWVSEGQGSDKQKKATGEIVFTYHKLRCAVAISLEVDTMAMSVFETTLINNVVEAMVKGIEKSIINGTGTGQPKGILAEAAPAKQKIDVQTPSYNDLIEAEGALPQAYESGAVWCMSKKTFMTYYGLTDSTGQPICRVNYGIGGKPERSLLGRTVIVCDYVNSYDASLAAGTTFAFLFNFKDYVLNTNYNMGVKKYEDNDTDDIVTKAIMLVDGKVVDKNSLVILNKKA